MQQQVTLKLQPQEAASNSIVKEYIAKTIGVPENSITGFYVLKQSIDARSRQQIWVNITAQVFINEPFIQRTIQPIQFKNVEHAKHKIIVVGAGPAGIFAALKLIELGIKPIVIERGKDVRARRRDLAKLNKEGIVNPESNYCFGEGGKRK